MIIYTAHFGAYDDVQPGADILFDEANNTFDGCSQHLSPRLMAKLYKVLNPSGYDIWVDANVKILDRRGFEALFGGELCVFKHPFNKTIRDEINACAAAGYINQKQIKKIEDLYQSAGMHVDTTPVYACPLIYRTEKARQFNRLWWELICEYSYRDQLTFSFALAQFPSLDFWVVDVNIYNMDGVINPYFLFVPHKKAAQTPPAPSLERGIQKTSSFPFSLAGFFKRIVHPREDSPINASESIPPAYEPNADPVRTWSNIELRKLGALVEGDVANISGWEDKDKDGGFYRDYFPHAKTYTITNHTQHLADKDQEILLNLEQHLPAELAGHFDVIFTHTVLEHIFDVRLAFRNLAAMTRDIIITVVPFIQQQHETPDYNDYWRFTPTVMRHLAKENGMQVVYENYRRDPYEITYVISVATKNPLKWKAIMPPYEELSEICKWIG